MPFPRPTLTALRTQAMQDITASDLPNADGFLRRAVLRVLAWVQAGLAYLHYGYLDWISLQSTPFTAEDEYLDAWAALAPTPVLRNAPGYASGLAIFSPASVTLPAGTLMLRSDGVQYRTTADAPVSGSSVTASIIAVVAGSAGDADGGTPLTLATAVAGISSTGSAAAAITGGTDLELDASVRSRMLESYATPPAGGSAADYVTWALQVSAVTRAWCLRNGSGPGTVTVFVMMDVTEAAHNGFPQGTNGVAALETRDTAATGDQLAVANHLYPLEPVTAIVYVVAPTPSTVNFTIAGLSSTTSGQRAQVNAALAAMFVSKGSPLGTVSITQSDVDSAVTAISGLPSFSVTSPSSWPLTPSLGSLLTLGTVTYA